MGNEIVLCTDGSDLAIAALRAGLDLLGSTEGLQVVTVMSPPDHSLVTGAGIAGGTMTSAEFDQHEDERRNISKQNLADTVQALGLDQATSVILHGSPGPAIVAHADEIDARAIVIGSRGRGGLKRAVLGSVSDHVVRNAHCPVVVLGQPA